MRDSRRTTAPIGREKERLQRVLQQDRMNTSAETIAMLRSDVAHLLQDYFDLDTDTLQVNLDAREDGAYAVRIVARAVRIKS